MKRNNVSAKKKKKVTRRYILGKYKKTEKKILFGGLFVSGWNKSGPPARHVKGGAGVSRDAGKGGGASKKSCVS